WDTAPLVSPALPRNAAGLFSPREHGRHGRLLASGPVGADGDVVLPDLAAVGVGRDRPGPDAQRAYDRPHVPDLRARGLDPGGNGSVDPGFLAAVRNLNSSYRRNRLAMPHTRGMVSINIPLERRRLAP